MPKPPIAALLPLLYAPASPEVEFNCPWCNTRLALPRADFTNERAVLCPRCNNPIDLDIQRRLAKTSPGAGRPVSAPPTPPTEPRRRVTTPTAYTPPTSSYPAPQPTPPPPPRYTASTPDAAGQAPKAIGVREIDAAFGSDATRLGDVNALTGGRPAIRSAPVAPIGSGTTSSAGTGMGNKITCPSCNYENAPVPKEFSFGTVQKCSWCGKPLPV